MGFPDRPQFKDEEIAALCFVLVLGEFGPSSEPLWTLPVGFHLLEEGGPGLIELDQDLIAHLARQGLVGIRRLDQMIDGGVVEVAMLENERLPTLVVSKVPE